MKRSTTTIKNSSSSEKNISVVILSAGAGLRIRSNEPRSLIKIKDKTLINHQIEAVCNSFKACEVIGVFGIHIDKIIKKVDSRIRVVENQLYEDTNNSESMRLGLNNSLFENVIFIHGDIYFDSTLLKDANYNKSFLVLQPNTKLIFLVSILFLKI